MKYPRKMQGYRDRVQAAAARGDVQAREAMCLVLYLEEVNGGPKTREWQRRKLAAALLKQDLEADIPRRDGLWGDGRGKCHECRRKFTGEPRLMFQRVYALGGSLAAAPLAYGPPSARTCARAKTTATIRLCREVLAVNVEHLALVPRAERLVLGARRDRRWRNPHAVRAFTPKVELQ